MNLNQIVSSCYIHIPFCNNICSYCDFCKLFYNEKLVDKYLESLEKETKKIYKGEVLNTIYIGGGTPSSLSLKQLKRLFEILEVLKKNSNIEYTVECNFDSVTFEKLELMKLNGVNRLSFGMESINKNNLDVLDRREHKERIRNVISLCRDLGFNNINIDLMYAIPGEGLEDLKEDIDFLLSLDLEHISCYSLIIEENTKLFIKKTEYIDDELDFLMYNYICDRLKEKYVHYEISNFCKKGYESRHNLCYWNNENYYGFGLSAASYIDNIRYTNTRSINKYLSGNYLLDKEELTKSDIMSYEMILGLRKLNGVDKNNFYNKYNISINDCFNIKSLFDKGLLKDEDGYIKIEEKNLYISNEILVYFIKE